MRLDQATEPERIFAANLRKARNDEGLTQKQVAQGMALLGFSWVQTTVAKVESGDRPISLNEAFCLSACVRRDIVHLMGLPEQAQIMEALQSESNLQTVQAQMLEVIQEENRRHIQALRTYLTEQLAQLGPEEE